MDQPQSDKDHASDRVYYLEDVVVHHVRQETRDCLVEKEQEEDHVYPFQPSCLVHMPPRSTVRPSAFFNIMPRKPPAPATVRKRTYASALLPLLCSLALSFPGHYTYSEGL